MTGAGTPSPGGAAPLFPGPADLTRSRGGRGDQTASGDDRALDFKPPLLNSASSAAPRETLRPAACALRAVLSRRVVLTRMQRPLTREAIPSPPLVGDHPA